MKSGPGPGLPAVEVGTECHAVMERLDFARPRIPKSARPESRKILEGFFKSDPFRELAASEILARELPFVLSRDGQVVSGVIDVVYRAGETVWVADYKTDRAIEPEHYALIGEIYTEAARRALGGDPRFKLIYLRHGRAVVPGA